MNITDTRVTVLENGSNVIALASITIDSAFVVTGLRIINSTKGIFVSMPNRKDANGEYRDIAFPITKEAREQIQDSVLRAYEQATYVAPVEPVSEREVVDVDADSLPF